MPLQEPTRAARRVDQARLIVSELDNLYRTHQNLRRRITQFIAQGLHQDGTDETVFANDDTPVEGSHEVVWRELYEAKDISDDFVALFLNSGTAGKTASEREQIARQRGYDLP